MKFIIFNEIHKCFIQVIQTSPSVIDHITASHSVILMRMFGRDSELCPYQSTTFSFPKGSFEGTKVTMRLFQAFWFHKWPYLHYDETRDLAFCRTCVMGFKEKRLNIKNANPAFFSSTIIRYPSTYIVSIHPFIYIYM